MISASSLSKLDKSKYHPLIAEALDIIELNFDKNITLSDCAKQLHVNNKYLGRLFQQQTNRSFHEILNDVRISHAKYLLKITNHSIIEIALVCGYNTVSYFSRIFKKKTGVSPTEYRKQRDPSDVNPDLWTITEH